MIYILWYLSLYCRGGKDEQQGGTGALYGWDIPLCYHNDSVPDEIPPNVDQQSLPILEGYETCHISESQLYGPAHRV